MNVRCPECETLYRVDPGRVPDGGARVRCTRCEAVFAVGREQEVARPEPVGSAPAAPSTPVFGPQDPGERARRFARALVSDIVAYHGDRREESLRAGTLKRDFREEILKSWEEYVLQVGEDTAKQTPYFRDALNDILAKGTDVF